MIETGKITNFILLIKEELRENIGGILAMVMGVLAALYTIWLTLTYLPAEPFPFEVTPTPITAAPSYLFTAYTCLRYTQPKPHLVKCLNTRAYWRAE